MLSSLFISTLALAAAQPAQPAEPAQTAQPADDQPVATRVTASLTTERIPLVGVNGPIRIVTDALASRLELRAPKQRRALAARLQGHLGTICPTLALTAAGVELRCRTRQLDAAINVEAGKRFLDIHELRGLPWRDGPDAPPAFLYDPAAIGLGAPCPGESPVAKGECALAAGDKLAAAGQFRAAIASRDRQVAMIRLGDLSQSIGDPTTAMGWYVRAGVNAPFGRVARARICEIEGRCLESTAALRRVFDTAGLPEPVRADLRIRAVRAEAYAGRIESAFRMLVAEVENAGAASVCREGGEAICRRILLEQLQLRNVAPSARPPADDRRDGEAALDLYLSLPAWDRGYLAPDLASAAADLAARIGAPIFGGQILAAAAPAVPGKALPDHLLHAAELFLDGEDAARTRLVLEYARTRIVRRASPRWTSVERRLADLVAAESAPPAPAPDAAALVDAAGVSKEVGAALATAGRAHRIAGAPRGLSPGASGADGRDSDMGAKQK